MSNTQSKLNKWMYYVSGAVLGILLIYFAVGYFSKPKATIASEIISVPEQHQEVSVAIAGNESISEYITLNGVTKFLKTSTIRSSATGYITGLKYNINSYIGKGNEFCAIRTKEQDALKEIKRLDPSLKVFNKPLTIRSNGSGLITSLNIHNGDYISEGDIMAEIIEPSSLILVVNVPYEYNEQIRIGTPCEVIFSDNNKMNLNISGIMPTIEVASQTQAYYISLPNKKLPENLNVTINLLTKKSASSALTIPVEALQTDELEKEYWVMKVKNGRALKTPIVKGSQNAEWVEIKEGNIAFGDSIVTEGSYQLEDSSLVSIQE